MSKRNRIISLEKYSSCHIFVKMYKDKCANIYHRKWWESFWNGKSIAWTCKVCYIYSIDIFFQMRSISSQINFLLNFIVGLLIFAITNNHFRHFLSLCRFFIIVKRRGNTTWLSVIFHDPANSALRNKRHNMFNRKTIISK